MKKQKVFIDIMNNKILEKEPYLGIDIPYYKFKDKEDLYKNFYKILHNDIPNVNLIEYDNKYVLIRIKNTHVFLHKLDKLNTVVEDVQYKYHKESNYKSGYRKIIKVSSNDNEVLDELFNLIVYVLGFTYFKGEYTKNNYKYTPHNMFMKKSFGIKYENKVLHVPHIDWSIKHSENISTMFRITTDKNKDIISISDEAEENMLKAIVYENYVIYSAIINAVRYHFDMQNLSKYNIFITEDKFGNRYLSTFICGNVLYSPQIFDNKDINYLLYITHMIIGVRIEQNDYNIITGKLSKSFKRKVTIFKNIIDILDTKLSLHNIFLIRENEINKKLFGGNNIYKVQYYKMNNFYYYNGNRNVVKEYCKDFFSIKQSNIYLNYIEILLDKVKNMHCSTYEYFKIQQYLYRTHQYLIESINPFIKLTYRRYDASDLIKLITPPDPINSDNIEKYKIKIVDDILGFIDRFIIDGYEDTEPEDIEPKDNILNYIKERINATTNYIIDMLSVGT